MSDEVQSPRLPALAEGPVDAHAHVFTRALRIGDDARYAPACEAPVARYEQEIAAAGVAAALLVQPSFLGVDNGYLVRAIARAPERFRGVAVTLPTITEHELTELAAAGVVGVRLNLIGSAVPDVRRQPWRGFLARLETLSLHLEVQAEGEQWTALRPLFAGPGPRIVIDHMGRPAKASVEDAALSEVLAAAARPHVWIKLSGPYRFRADPRDVVALILDRIGPDRLLWGSDWPWTQHPEITSYATTLSWLDAWLPDAAASRLVLERNPRRLFRRGREIRMPWTR